MPSRKKSDTGKIIRTRGAEHHATKRKEEQQQIADAMNYIKTIFEASPIGIITYKESGEAISVNPAAAAIVGATIEQVRKQNFRKLKSWKRSGLLEAASAALVSNEQKRIEVHDISTFGRESWFAARFVPFMHQGRKELLALLTDTTQRKQAEEALRQSEERFSKAYKTSPYAYMIANMEDGAIIEVNDAFTNISGVTREEALASSTLKLNFWVNAEDRQRMVVALRESGVVERMETRLRAKNGDIMTVLVFARAIRLGQRSCIISIMEDITERKRAEEALHESEERFKTLSSITTEGIMIHEGEIILDANRAFARLAGYDDPEDLIGKNGMEIIPFTPESAQRVREHLASGTTESYDIELIGRDGRVILAETSGCDILYQGCGARLTRMRDITDRKKTESLLMNAHKLESLGVLAGGIAHDFNNLLTGIFGNIDLARSKSKDARTIEFLDATLAAMNRAKGLTHQLLTFSKGGSPVQKITPLVPFIQETAQFVLSGSNISCRFSLAENLWPCHIDKNQVGQVIDNIVINAQQAMPGGGTIEVTAANCSFGEKEHPPLAKGDYVKVAIKDSGIGIPKEIMPRIFDPFYTTKTKGHGLGLATCYSIINRHGGCIDVESEPGKGSTFHVYLPASAEAVTVNAVPAAIRKGSGTIIVVDDEEMVRETFRQMLEALGYTVICKNDGKEALDFYGREKDGCRFAAMIFDLTIPGGMGGKEAIAAIRECDKEIPVFVASGYADNSVMMHPNDYGFTASISKPFTIAELSEMLNKHLKN